MLKLIKRILRIILSRTFILAIILISQIVLLGFLIYKIGSGGIYVYFLFLILSIIESFFIMNRKFNPAYKISWLIAIFALPFFGVFFYWLFGRIKLTKREIDKFEKEYLKLQEYNNSKEKIDLEDKDFIKVSKYISNTTLMPVFDKTESLYLSLGELAYPKILEEIKKAKKYIFLEFFIVKDGVMWSSIYEILKEKVKEGVDVRLIYDDFGCLSKLKSSFPYELKKNGIKVAAFNTLLPVLSMKINYRDHRKIIVIDGNVAFTGGMNLSDEYININSPFGYWKDSMIMLKGKGVDNLTFMFLSMWKRCKKEDFDFNEYKSNCEYLTDGFVQVFGDGPFTQEQSTEMTYMQIINEANHYVYITTPYLILDNEVLTALKTAALSGIDVRITVPHIPDKKIVYMITKSYYQELLDSGVRIYEYTPGFIHSKTIISDDSLGIVGSANFDYRSLYLHYEVSCMLYDTSSLQDIKQDYLKIIEESEEIKKENIKKSNIFKKIFVSILRVFSPMM